MPIDLAQVDWLYVGLLTAMAFVASLIGALLSFQARFTGAAISAILFAVLYLALTYYPHGLPLPAGPSVQKTTVAPPPPPPPSAAGPATSVRPANPVRDITPPRNPVTDITPGAR